MEKSQRLRKSEHRRLSAYQDSLGDGRSFSWSFFLDLGITKKVMHIWKNTGKASFFIAQWAEYVVSLHHDLHKHATLDKKKQDWKRDNIHFVYGKYDNIPFKNEIFDVIIYEMPQQSKQSSKSQKEETELIQVFTAMKEGGQLVLIRSNPFFLFHLIKKNKINRKYLKREFLTYKGFFKAHKNLMVRSGFSEVKVLYFYKGPLGESCCLYGSNYRAIDYYYRNFTAVKGARTIKRMAYYLIARTKIYKLVADQYFFIGFKRPIAANNGGRDY